MIDTDKYEGHTPAPWIIDWSHLNVDKELMQDAPLLLAEVKRLREGIEHALHIRLRHGQEEGWKELQELIE